MESEKSKMVVIIVAHPDDETLWTGGTMLSHPDWNCFVVCLCRKNDQERANKFYRVLEVLNAEGIMGDLDDGPDQRPLTPKQVEEAILQLLPQKHFDLVISHDPSGEYTRHARHEEVGKAVIHLWTGHQLSAKELWTFAYEDGHRSYYPIVQKNASICQDLSTGIWLQKYSIITETYGFEKTSWEAQTTPKAEAFWQFTDRGEANRWIKQSENSLS